MMKTYLAAGLLVSGCMLSASAGAVAQPDPNGIWNRGDGNARVRVEPCGKDFCATNIWVKDTSKGEAVGDVLVMMVEAKSEKSMAGTAFDRKRELTYSMDMKVEENTMSTRGCVLRGVICQSATWERVR